MPDRIPIKAAKNVALAHDLRQVILLGWDGSLTHIVTFGKSVEDCAQAAAGGNMLKEKWGWPECNDQPSRLTRLEASLLAAKLKNDALESQVVELTGWKNSAMIQLGKADKLQVVLPPKYLGRDVYEAAVEELRELTARLENARDARDLALDRGSKLGREVINLRASVERLTASRNDLELAANSYMKQIQQHVDFLAERNALIAELRGEKAKELAMTMRPTEISRATELAKLMYNADHFKIAYEDHLKICPGPPMLLPSCYIEQSKQIRELTAELSREIGKSSVLRKTIERLTGTLKSVLASASPNPKNHPAMTEAWRNARTVLAEKGLTGELKEARK